CCTLIGRKVYTYRSIGGDGHMGRARSHQLSRSCRECGPAQRNCSAGRLTIGQIHGSTHGGCAGPLPQRCRKQTKQHQPNGGPAYAIRKFHCALFLLQRFPNWCRPKPLPPSGVFLKKTPPCTSVKKSTQIREPL